MKKIVTLIPSATEIVAFLGKKDSIIGCSHECDYPKDLNNIARLTSPKINIHGTSKTINKEINTILENSLSIWLDLNLKTLNKRIKWNKKRPLLLEKNAQEVMKKLYVERRNIYKLSHHKINCNNLSKGNIAKKIIIFYEKH